MGFHTDAALRPRALVTPPASMDLSLRRGGSLATLILLDPRGVTATLSKVAVLSHPTFPDDRFDFPRKTRLVVFVITSVRVWWIAVVRWP